MQFIPEGFPHSVAVQSQPVKYVESNSHDDTRHQWRRVYQLNDTGTVTVAHESMDDDWDAYYKTDRVEAVSFESLPQHVREALKPES